ncbi:MAG TPA: M1 family metallopeptidase [Candidatus Saccharimonadales bacterium]|jgi:aminopeptidase N|nr:M1 family metallopeptidase [Candidatus Saccharimonadales bacterium]
MATFVKSIGALLLLSAALAGAQRLPANTVPEHYDLTFTPDLLQATFTGVESVRVRLNQPGRSVVLNAAEIEFKQASITQEGKTQIAQVNADPGKEQATLTVAEPLVAGPASIQIEFTGTLNDKLRGFYLARTRLRSYATTQFESTDARRAFPSFDEPALKATFSISLIVDKDDTAISNGRIISDTPGPGANKHTLKFSTTKKMSSYLVAMAIGDFECNEAEESGIPVRVCGTPDKKLLGKVALRYAAEILRYYNGYYGIPYPFEKLDIVGVPDFEAGAMENTGAIFYRESLLFIDEKNSAVDSRVAVFEVLAHEMAHQWFGDLVTMKWWDNIWLNEGFATWMESKPSQALHPEWHGALAAVRAANTALMADSLRSTHPIHARAETPEEINELFDSISYEKSAAVLRMIETYVSPEVFRRGVNAYLRKFSYGNATAEDFWGTITAASLRPVNRIMPTFVNQPGVPLIKVRSVCIQPPAVAVVKSKGRRARRVIKPQPKTEITITQQRFQSGAPAAGATDPPWMVPVCIKSEAGKAFCQVFGERTQTVRVAGCSSWVFANANAVGYYRTQYDPAALRGLGPVLMDQLTTAERMSLVQDQAALTLAGQESAGAFLDLVAALNQDQEYSIVDAYASALEGIRNYLVTGEDRQAFQEWTRSNFRPLMAKVGWSSAKEETDDTRLLRATLVKIMGSIAEDPETIRTAMKLARQYLKDPNSVDASMAQEVLVVAARNGDAALFEDYLNAMNGMTAPEQFYAVSFALANFRDPKIVERVLKNSVSEAVRNQDAAGLIAAVVRKPENQEIAWAWVKDHWADVEKKITMSSGGAIVNATGTFCEAGMRDDVKQFFTEHKVPSTERTLKLATERMNTCISFRERQKSNLAAWLHQHGNGGNTAGNR